MTVSRGKVHEFLGMTLDYSTKGVCKVSMFKYIDECIAEFQKLEPKATKPKETAAPVNLFVVREAGEKLEPTKAC